MGVQPNFSVVGLQCRSGLERRVSLSRSWMRKVVGSNPSDAELDRRFSFVDSIQLKKGDWLD